MFSEHKKKVAAPPIFFFGNFLQTHPPTIFLKTQKKNPNNFKHHSPSIIIHPLPFLMSTSTVDTQSQEITEPEAISIKRSKTEALITTEVDKKEEMVTISQEFEDFFNKTLFKPHVVMRVQTLKVGNVISKTVKTLLDRLYDLILKRDLPIIFTTGPAEHEILLSIFDETTIFKKNDFPIDILVNLIETHESNESLLAELNYFK
jgi:hypothetical protein